MSTWRVIEGDCRTALATLPAESAHTCVTSPPYFGLRSYGTEPQVWGGRPDCPHEWVSEAYYREGGAGKASAEAFSQAGPANAERIKAARWRDETHCVLCGAWRGELGLERSLSDYVAHLVSVFREVRRVLRGDGTAWLVIGDSYAGSWGNYGGKNRGGGMQRPIRVGSLPSPAWDGREDERPAATRPDRLATGLKEKDLIGIPWRVAFALQEDGWWLRSDVIWAKKNGLPESVTDRPTRSHEYVFLLTKRARYYFDADAIAEPVADASLARLAQDIESQEGSHRANGGAKTNGTMKTVIKKTGRNSLLNLERVPRETNGKEHEGGFDKRFETRPVRNKRDVWHVATAPFAEAHFATFPPALILPCILAGAPAGGTVIDPFCGSGTSGMVALRHDRSFIGIELNPEYAAMARRRISGDAPLLNGLEAKS